MDRRFAAEEWGALAASEQMMRCSLLAQEALKLADNAPPKLSEGYILLAEQWLRLGMEIGHHDGSAKE
jgi:hypothetical protein